MTRHDEGRGYAARTVFMAVLCGLLTICVHVRPARAEIDYRAALVGFAFDTYADTDKAVGDIADSGENLSLAVVEALQSGRLYYTTEPRAVFYQDKAGALHEAASGALLSRLPSGLRPVRINNRIRNTIRTAIGRLTLVAPDAERRFAAAQSVFRSRDSGALPLLASTMWKEPDGRVRQAMKEAFAAIIAVKDDAPEVYRLQAIERIKSRGDQEALSLLSSLAGMSDGQIKMRAEAAVAAITLNLTIWNAIQNVWYGLSLGSVLLLAAIGLAITFGVMGVINMAHGEMVMLGAYVTYIVQEAIRTNAPPLFDQSLFIAIPLAFVVTGLIGILIERSMIRFLYGRPLESLLATFGLSLILQQMVRSLFGANNREVGAPSFMAGAFDLGGLSVTFGRMWIVLFALAVFAGIQLLLRYTSFGVRMRAVTQNRRMASAMGIDTNRIDALAFGLGSGIAGIAGVALSQLDNVSPNLGQSYIIDSFLVVIFGGVGNVWGTLVAGLTLGVANKLLEPVADAVLGKILLLVFIILFIQKRPRGMFAIKGRAVEA